MQTGRTRSHSTLRRDRFWNFARRPERGRARGFHYGGRTTTKIDWEAAKARGGGGETDSDSRSGSSTDGEKVRNEESEEESKASGSSGAEWSGASADE